MASRVLVAGHGDIHSPSYSAASSSIESTEVGDPPSSTPGNGVSPGSGVGHSPEGDRIAELRAILPDLSIAELRQMLRENDSVSDMSHRTEDVGPQNAGERAGESKAGAVPPLPVERRRSSVGRGRRRWYVCDNLPEAWPVADGGPVGAGAALDVGETDPIELEIRRIEAATLAREALNERLGYDLHDSGQYEEMERQHREGERWRVSSGREEAERVFPEMTLWDEPPILRGDATREPDFPELGGALPLPLLFWDQNGVLCDPLAGYGEVGPRR